MERRYTTMNLSAVCIGKYAYDDVPSTSYNWVPTVRQGSKRYTATKCIMLVLNGVLLSQLLQSIVVFNFTHMHSMSYWSDDFPRSRRVNIEEPAVCLAL